MSDDEIKPEIEEDLNEEEEAKMAFANAEIVRLIKNNLPEGRMIKKRVKVAMNKFLEEIATEVCQKLAKEPYTYIEIDMLERAMEPYKNIKSLEVEKNRIIANLNKIKAECDVMIDDINRKFSMFESEKDEY
ncbi:MAG: hypothetical protein PHT91_04085 [Candidatus Nanoarchaeia archaeon]|nr:hypothetical protein [Candidatus Nanoarchaeia archaeon]MDD5054053.1 hypothetical protein [Candidatus Nanoarchaeia archaeon]MDD5500024.1 hypothetical protein [Candidatus Nanoarchaeia archaeon]